MFPCAIEDAAIPTIIQVVDSTHGTVAPPPTLQLQAPFELENCEKMPGGVGCNICKLDLFLKVEITVIISF